MLPGPAGLYRQALGGA
uniref:Uncharacterized protein n=1 Tax=Oryza meridionalis TaxID=40149 RepID=A0A0E0EWN3_9ORYZ